MFCLSYAVNLPKRNQKTQKDSFLSKISKVLATIYTAQGHNTCAEGEMMPINKTLVAVGVVAAVAVAGVGSYGMANAISDTGGGGAIIDRLVEKFNLNRGDVESVFSQVREERQAQRQERRAERLQQAVDDGVITAEQKVALEEKLDGLDATREKEREELQAWAEEQGLDLRAVMGRGGDGPRGEGRHRE